MDLATFEAIVSGTALGIVTLFWAQAAVEKIRVTLGE